MVGDREHYLHEHRVSPNAPRIGLVARIINKICDVKMPGKLVMHPGLSGLTKGRRGCQKRKAEDGGSLSKADTKARITRN